MKKHVLGLIALVLLVLVPSLKVDAAKLIASNQSEWVNVNANNSTKEGSFVIDNNVTSIHLFVELDDTTSETIPEGTSFTAELSFGGSPNYSYDSATGFKAKNASSWETNVKVNDGKLTITATAKKTISKTLRFIEIPIKVADNVESTDKCTISLQLVNNPVTPKCKVENGVYYDNNGNIVSKDVYDQKCPSTVPQENTGSAISYVIIIGTIAIAAVLFMYTKKNKIYHI